MTDLSPGYAAMVIAGALATYVIASVNFSLLMAKRAGISDLRRTGSGNAGTVNLFRSAGLIPAFLVLLLDIARAAGVIAIVTMTCSDFLWPLAALFLFLGNIFPLFHSFRGGKGIATALGSALVLDVVSALFGVLSFIAILRVSRRASVASLSMMFSIAIITTVRENGFSAISLTVCLLLTGTIWTHRHNIMRLLRREEPILSTPGSNKESNT